MESFATTPEQRAKQETNVIAADLEAEIRALRERRAAQWAKPTRLRLPSVYFLRRMQIAYHNAGNKMSEVENHWLKRGTA